MAISSARVGTGAASGARGAIRALETVGRRLRSLSMIIRAVEMCRRASVSGDLESIRGVSPSSLNFRVGIGHKEREGRGGRLLTYCWRRVVRLRAGAPTSPHTSPVSE